MRIPCTEITISVKRTATIFNTDVSPLKRSEQET
jgi:hypothetical protein